MKMSTEAVELQENAVSSDVASAAEIALHDAHEFAKAALRPDGHWCGELKSNVTITAEYVFLRQSLGLDMSADREPLYRYLFSQQNKDGSWGLAPHHPGDVSTTAEAYLALKILGHSIHNCSAMVRARDFVTQVGGGLAKVRIFTRINLATFGLFPWSAVPQLPAELILLPSAAPINIYRLSSWARTTIVPLLVVCHHRPIFALPNGLSANNDFLDELWCENTLDKNVPYHTPLWALLVKLDLPGLAFTVVDKALSQLGGLRSLSWNPLRRYALRQCMDWILSHQESSGDWAGIFPPMHAGILALFTEGFKVDDSPLRRALEAMERFAWQDEHGKRIQPCVSPVWDTVLMSIAFLDASRMLVPPLKYNENVDAGNAPIIECAVAWVKAHQLVGNAGDWRIYRPFLVPGGFSFEYFNTLYADIDDTAAAIIAFLKHDPTSVASDHVLDAVKWILGMQNKDGGWAAFDVENDRLFLNKIPFSDMDSLCDPSTADIVGRVLEAFGLVLQSAHECHKASVAPLYGLLSRIRLACDNAINYLAGTQEVNGSWFGRWVRLETNPVLIKQLTIHLKGVNFIYGTSNVLCGLAYFCFEDSTEDSSALSLVGPALRFLLSIQNADGGWGEGLSTYKLDMVTADEAEMRKLSSAPSTPSQTAWALMAILPYVPSTNRAVEAGVKYLLQNQTRTRLTSATANKRDGCLEGIEVNTISSLRKSIHKGDGRSWSDEFYTGTGFPNHFYLGYNLYSHYFPMMALGRYLQTRQAEQNGARSKFSFV